MTIAIIQHVKGNSEFGKSKALVQGMEETVATDTSQFPQGPEATVGTNSDSQFPQGNQTVEPIVEAEVTVFSSNRLIKHWSPANIKYRA